MFDLFRGKQTSFVDMTCSVCQGQASYGYSDRPESSLEDIHPLCLTCLRRQLLVDYQGFAGRAVVVEPAPGPPVYVFQLTSEWNEHFPESSIANDVLSMLQHMDNRCRVCGTVAGFLWVNSRGLSESNFEDVLDRGLTETLLKDNPAPEPLCAMCCVGRVSDALEAKQISFLEVCSPKGDEAGFVLPMGY